MRTQQAGLGWFWAAAAAGSVHGAWSLYWALGGQWMLATVGRWAVEAAAEPSLSVTAGLWAVALVKLIAAWVPLLGQTGRLPVPGLWRGLSWAGAGALLAYGLMNVVVSGAVLLGLLKAQGPVNTEAMVGHAALWGPLFALWGVALGVGLWRSRTPA